MTATQRAIDFASTLLPFDDTRPTVYVAQLITGDWHVGTVYQDNSLSVGDEPVLAGPTFFADTPRIIWVAE